MIKNQAPKGFDFNLKTSHELKKFLNLKVAISDSMNANFAKDISGPLFDLFGLGLSEAEQLIFQEDDTKVIDTDSAFNYNNYVPKYPDNFSFGGQVGLGDNIVWNIGLQFFKMLYNDQNYSFKPWIPINWWVLGTRTDWNIVDI